MAVEARASPGDVVALLVAALLGTGLVVGCAPPAATHATTAPDAVAPHVGRSICPGAVPSVETNLRGAIADELERLQRTYEQEPWFLAVVFDGTKSVVIVEAARLPEWQLRLAPSGVAVARSCVDPALLAAIQAVLPTVGPRKWIVSAGYNGLDDSIDVLGVDAETLIRALDEPSPESGSAARRAIADGTLRIDPQQMPDSL